MNKIFIIFLLMIMVAGCATKQRSPAEEFKGQSAEEIFKKGEKALAQKKYESAIKPLEALDALYPFSPYQQQAKLDLMYAYYRSDDYAGAAATAVRYIHLYPRTKSVDYAYYMRGMANFNQDRGLMHRYVNLDLSKRDLGTSKEAFNDFAELIRRYPDSMYAPDARERMIYLRNMMAQHELDVADFYYRHQMYVASQNRANFIVRHYQQSPQVVPALGLMVETARQLGLKDLEQQSLQILQMNYPNSAVYQRLK